jgi:hypothetical protein
MCEARVRLVLLPAGHLDERLSLHAYFVRPLRGCCPSRRIRADPASMQKIRSAFLPPRLDISSLFQPRLLHHAIECAWRQIVAGLSWNGDESRLHRMLILTMTSLRPSKEPRAPLYEPDNVPHLHDLNVSRRMRKSQSQALRAGAFIQGAFEKRKISRTIQTTTKVRNKAIAVAKAVVLSRRG